MIYCIIVTYNGKKWIDRCLHSLDQSTTPIIPIVIDNNSIDGTVAHIETHYSNVILLPQKTNKGFGQANNIGIEYAINHQASHVLLLNQDAAIEKDTISTLLKYDDGKTLLTPIHMNGNGSQFDDNFYRNTLLCVTPMNEVSRDILYVNAACWFMPIRVIHQVGGFNPLFYHYGEDNNYILRLQYYHFGIKLITGTVIYHDREKHGNEQLFQRGVLYRKLLLIQTDINLTITQRWLKLLKTSIQEIGRSIKRHYFSVCIKEYISAICKLMAQRKAIQNSRRIEANTRGAWLTL